MKKTDQGKENNKLEGMEYRDHPLQKDLAGVESLVRSTGFFNEEEVRIAVELVQERLALEEKSGYSFIFAERENTLIGYSCYGKIPLTKSSYDLYWIVVHPDHQGKGIGRVLLSMTEFEVLGMGGSAVYADTSSRPQYEPTRAFYANTGFLEAAHMPDFYAPGDGKIVFVKKL